VQRQKSNCVNSGGVRGASGDLPGVAWSNVTPHLQAPDIQARKARASDNHVLNPHLPRHCLGRALSIRLIKTGPMAFMLKPQYLVPPRPPSRGQASGEQFYGAVI